MSRSSDLKKEISDYMREKFVSFMEKDAQRLKEHKDKIRAYKHNLLSDSKKINQDGKISQETDSY